MTTSSLMLLRCNLERIEGDDFFLWHWNLDALGCNLERIEIKVLVFV
ncbi:MAG: hypothetical protein GU357_01765 [Thermofilum sp.]|nr:hypothetical protein [Thermofilum sp.]